MRHIKGAFFVLFTLTFLGVNGQSESSTYSARGIGLLNYQGLPSNLAMGEVGIATPSRFTLNFQNSAFLPFNNLTLFQVGLEMDQRSLSNSTESSKKMSAGLRYMNFAFPVISGKWTTSFGITPYSTVNYNSFSNDTPSDGQPEVTTIFSGSGGLTSFKWANGFKISDELYLGVRGSYIFGVIEKEELIFLKETLVSNKLVNFANRSSYKGVGLDLSMGYRKVLANENAVNFGAVYELSFDLKGRNNQSFEILNSSLTPISLPTLVAENERVFFKRPSSLGLGASYQVGNKYVFGIDVKTTHWKEAGADGEQFRSTTDFGLGGQWTPNFSSVIRYFSRVTYRLGVSMATLPYEVDGKTIREFGINFGGSLPVGVSVLDLAFKYGGLGTTENDLIKETYFKVVMGATINDRWFIKRRYN